MMTRHTVTRLGALGMAAGLLWLQTLTAQDTQTFPTLGTIHRLDPRAEALLPEGAKIEVLGSGFTWCEGPTWFPDAAADEGGYLLFSEIPSNSVMRWDWKKGVQLHLRPAGFTGIGTYSEEPGSNGLAIDRHGRLVSCEHGDRRVSVLTPGGGKRTLVDHFQGKRLNSPNDLCVRSDGTLYFTDPIYGLPLREKDPTRELDICGVYRVTPGGVAELVSDQMTRPNGIALSPDERTLYVAQSDAKAMIWMAFPLTADGAPAGPGKVFKDITAEAKTLGKGAPDGLKVDAQGNLWATGPGGLHVMANDGTLLARLETGQNTSNCCFGGPDGTTLFLTVDMFICRVSTKVKGASAGIRK
jgi:gluconolactonase